jgi:hypothetical protein
MLASWPPELFEVFVTAAAVVWITSPAQIGSDCKLALYREVSEASSVQVEDPEPIPHAPTNMHPLTDGVISAVTCTVDAVSPASPEVFKTGTMPPATVYLNTPGECQAADVPIVQVNVAPISPASAIFHDQINVASASGPTSGWIPAVAQPAGLPVIVFVADFDIQA